MAPACQGAVGGKALALDRLEYPLESRPGRPRWDRPPASLAPPPEGDGRGRNPRRRNPRRRQTRRQTAGAGEQPETTGGNRRGSAPGGGWRRAPLAPGVRGQGPGGPEPKRGSAGRPPAGGATGPGPPKGGWGPLPRSAEKGPATLGRAGPHTENSLRAANGPQTLGGRVGRLCPLRGARRPGPQRRPRVRPRWPDRGSGRGAGPRRSPRRTRIRAAWRPGDLSRRARGPGGLAALPRGCQSPRTARRGQERTGRTVHAALTMRASEGRRRSRRTVPRSAVGGPGCTAENLPKCHGPLPGPPLLDNRTLFHQYF